MRTIVTPRSHDPSPCEAPKNALGLRGRGGEGVGVALIHIKTGHQV
jgi:hypothetical protein